MGIINSYNIIHYGDVLTSCFKLGELSQSPAGYIQRISLRGGTTCFRYVTRKRIITNIPIAHVIHRLYAGFLTDRHWTVVRNLKLRRGLLIVQLKASSIVVQNDRNKV